MQFIEELTLIHKVAIVATIGLIMVLLLVSRRRTAAAALPDTSAAPAGAVSRRRNRAKAGQALPRRKRRKLAAEAAHAMGGVDAAPIPAIASGVPSISVPEVTIAPSVDEAIEATPLTAPIATEPVAVAVSDDPYLHDAPMGDAGAFVAQPGWPSPGELASSFDPDAFDPLPEAQEPYQQDESLYDGTHDAVEYDDTHAIELPGLSTANEVTALAEIEEWADTVDAETNWDETDDEELTSGNWTISEPQQATDVIDDVAPIALEEIWSEPDDESLWDQPEEVEVAAEDIEDLATALKNDQVFDAPGTDHVELDAPEADNVAFDVPVTAWADDSPGAWQVTDGPPVSAPQTKNLSAWNGVFGGHNSPVVLDLAWLAASGQSLELVIEPNADGRGVRLRFGAPSPAPVPVPAVTTVVIEEALADQADVPAAPETEPEVQIAAVPEPDTNVFDVPFLAGIAPVDEHPSAVDHAEPVDAPAPPTPEYMVVETPDVAEALVAQDPEQAMSEPAIAFVDHDRTATFDATVNHNDQFAYDTEPAGQNTATAVMGRDDDPARILADIRARLAALDAQR